MILNTPKIMQEFFQKVFRNLEEMSESQRNYVKAALCAILLESGKISMSKIGKTLVNFPRCKSSVSKMFKNKDFYAKEVAWQSAIQLCRKVVAKMSKKERSKAWVICFDTTHRSRFGKLLENMVNYKGSKSTKTYAFVWGLLIAPTGTRISLPCLQWYSRPYAKENNIKRKSQPQLAIQTIKYLHERLKVVGIDPDLVIVCDNAFECKALWKLCQDHNKNSKSKWTIISTCEKSRCLGNDDPEASLRDGKKVHEEFASVTLTKAKKLNPAKITGIQTRSQKKLQEPLTSHYYRYAKKVLCISKTGQCCTVISYKLKDDEDPLDQVPFQIFLCSDPSFTPEQVISYYTLRWEVETFFREQKSDLSFNHFEARSFIACYAFVDLLSVAFNFLEFLRLHLLSEDQSSSLQTTLIFARTRDLRNILVHIFRRDSYQWVLQRAQTTSGQRRIQKALTSFDMSSLCF